MMRKYSEQHQQAHDSNTSSASVSPRPQMRQTSPPDSLGSSVPAKRMRLGYDDRDRVSTTNTPGASSENGTGGSVPPPPPMRLPSPSSSSSVPSLHNSNSAGSAPYQSSQWPAPGTSAGDGSRSVPPLLPPPTIGGACAGTGPLLPPPNGHHGSGSSSNGGSHHQRLLPVVGAVHSDHHHALGRAWHTDPYVSDPPRARALTASFFAHIDSTALRFLPRQAFVSWLFATANTEAEADGRGGGHDATPVAATTAVTVAPASSIEVAAEAANATAIATPAAATPPRPSHKAPPPPPPSLHAAPKSPDPTITTNTTATTTAVSSSSSPSHPAASAAAAAGRASGNAHTKSPEDLMLVYSILAVGAAFLHREYQRRRRDEDEDDDMEERLKKRKAGAAAQIDDDIDRDDNDKMDVDNDNELTNSLGNDDYSLRLASRLGLHREARSLGAHYAAIVRYAQAHAGLSLQVVQARLLLSLYYLIVGRPCDSIEISGGAISAAVCMALNLEPEEETLLALRQEEDDNVDETMGGDVADDQEEDGMGKKRAAGSTSREPRYPWNMTRTQYIECRRRTYWACFVYERLDGSFPTRLSNLSAEDVFIRLPEREGVFDIEVGAPPIMVKASVMFDPSLANMALLDDDRTDCAVLGPLALVVTATVVWGDVMTNVYRMGQQHVRLLGRQSVPNSFGAFYAGATARLGRWRDAVRSQGFDLLADSHEERAGVVRRAVREGSLSSLLLAHLVHHVTAIKLHRHVTPRFWQQQKDGEVEGRLTRQSFAATARRHAQAILDAVAAVGSIFVGRFERHMAPLLVVDRQAPINRRSADRRRRQGDDDKDADATNPHGLNLPPPFLSHALLEAVDVLSSGGSATCLGRLVADLRAAHAVLTVLAAVWEAARLQADMVAARIDRFEDIMVEAEMMKTAKEPVKKDDADAGRPAGARTTGGNGNSNTAAGGKFRVFVDMDGDVSWRMLEPMDKRFARALDTVYPEE